MNPSKSFLLVEGTLKSSTAVPYYTADTLVSLINNSNLYMFSQISYEINCAGIEQIAFPGQATTMKGMLIYGDNFANAESLNMFWHNDTTVAAAAANVGFEARPTQLGRSRSTSP